MWNIKHLGHAILKRQNKIKIIYKFWQFLLFLKSHVASTWPPATDTFPGALAQSPWGKHWEWGWGGMAPLSPSSGNSELPPPPPPYRPPSPCIHWSGHAVGKVARERLLWKQGGRDSGLKMMKCIHGKIILTTDVIFFWNLCSRANKVSYPFDLFS